MLLQLAVEFQVGSREVTGGTCFEAHTGDILLQRKILQRFGCLTADSHAENGEIVNFHTLAVEQQFLDTVHHVGEYTFDDTARIR